MTENKSQWEKVKTANVVSILGTTGLIVIILLLMFFEIPESNENILMFLLGGYITTYLGGVVYFLFQYKKEQSE